MASAILVRGGGNNVFHGEATTKPCVRKYTHTKNVTAVNGSTNLSKKPTHLFHDATARGSQTPSVNGDTIDHPPSSTRGSHVTFDLDAYSKTELTQLKNRLVSELMQVRIFRCQIEASNILTRPIIHSLATSSGPKEPISKPPGKKKAFPAKRVNSFSGDGQTRKRRVVDNGAMKKCGQILGKLMKYKNCWVFNKPVDVANLGLYDYHLVIKNSMDLGTVKVNLEKGMYKSPVEFATDVRLTFNNALAYNPEGHDVYLMAELLAKRFEEMFNSVNEGENGRVFDNVVAAEQRKEKLHCGKEGFDRMSMDKPLLDNAAAPEIVRARGRPKGTRNSLKREMTLEEKVKLGLSLQVLPQDKMGQVMHILRKRNNGCFVQDGDEIELDIEAFDNKTLWELNRFVAYYKKVTSKFKRQQNKSPVREMEANLDDVEEDVDIGEEIPVANFPPVEIERDDIAMIMIPSDKSGSSSCGMDSSESDTDSGSSTGNDSDCHNRAESEAH